MIKRGALCLCLSLILGLMYGREGRWWFAALFLLLLAAVAWGIWRLFALTADKGNAGTILCAICVRTFLCTVLFVAGVAHMQAQQGIRDSLERVLSDGDNIIVEGKVLRKEESQPLPGKESAGTRGAPAYQAQSFQKQQFIYYLREAHVFADGRRYPCHGVFVYSSDGQYQPGHVLQAKGRYAPFSISRNEGNFNQRQYQQSRKWEFRVYADSQKLLFAQENQYAAFLYRLRLRMREVYARAMDDENAGVMADMALGEKSLLVPETKDLYRDAGISHVLAISGLHISILGMGILSMLQKLGCHRKWGAVFAAALVCSYCMLSGAEVSSVRAVGMFLLMMAAQVLGRSYDSVTALSFIAAFQLWDNPFLMGYAGFLFSYGAVLGVVVVWKTMERAWARKEEKQRKEKMQGKGKMRGKCRRLWRLGQNLGGIAGVSACIQMATLPLTAYFYYEIPLYSIPVNVCVLPFMGILLFLGFVGGLCGMAFPGLGELLLVPAGWLLSCNGMICSMAGKLPWANLVIGRPPLPFLLAYYAVLCLCLYLIWRRGRLCYLWGVALMLACLLFVRAGAGFEVDVLDVGQGDGIFIQNENGEHFFVDGGSSDVKNVGKYRILPFLKSRNIRSIKGWIVSHADADHISGLLELLQQGYPVETLILAKHMVRDEAMESLLQAAQGAGCEVWYVQPGMKFGSGKTVFTVLAPDVEGTERNAASLSVLLEHGAFTGVLTGDIGAGQEQELAKSGKLARHGAEDVDFYKAAHHGSNYSNSRELLETLVPRITVVSCGEGNSYGHPGREAVERIRDAGSRLYYTMEQGQICIRPGKEGVRVWTYLP